MKRVFIELPTWLGDAIMASSAINNIIESQKDIKITIFGSFVSTQAYQNYPNIEKIIK